MIQEERAANATKAGEGDTVGWCYGAPPKDIGDRFVLRLSKKMVSPLGKYGIGLLPRIPASIGNILKYWFLTDPTKYWNILEIWDPWLRNFIQT